MSEVIDLSDSEDFPWCRCEEDQPRALVVIALPSPLKQFYDTYLLVFPRRLHDFFPPEVLSHPCVPLVDAMSVLCHIYVSSMHELARPAFGLELLHMRCLRGLVALQRVTSRFL